MRLFRQSLILGKWFLPLLASSLCFAVQADRITGTIDSSQMVALAGDVHSFAQSRFDLGRADSAKVLRGVTLAFKPSAVQQAALDKLLAQQQDRSSPNYHKWLTPAQFADRFGMTQNDINRVETWLESQGFRVTSVANSRNQISFDGTVAQVESVFRTEIHDYLVDGEIQFANATNPSVPASLAQSVLTISHLHSFNPRPRAKIQKLISDEADPHFTSVVSGNHYLTPGDFATIYQVQALYSAGIDGTGETIAVVGQSSVLASDLSNFRSAAGLAAKAPQYILYPSSSISTRCAGDEGESDLDLEWSGGIAKNANIIFVYAGLLAGETCTGNRVYSVWDALHQAVDNNYAPVISISYGFCESGLPPGFPQQVRGWAQQANTQGQTILAATGDSGAADCDASTNATASRGLAVDIPAAIPEVTGMGGTEFNGDAEGVVTGGNVNTTQYWNGTTGGTDTISSALSYIPEMGWNDTALEGSLAASGGGASILFTKASTEASWQIGVGVPNDGKRDVPDLALNASPAHDPYLICSEDGQNGTIVPSCTTGFRTGAGGNLTAIGGTSCAAPSFAGVVALVNQYLVTNGFQTAAGIGNANPNLYYIAANNPTAMNDVTAGNNIVPCTQGSLSCPATSPFQYGFTAGVGYDQVTGLGSVNADTLATAWGELSTGTTTSIMASSNSINIGSSETFTATVTPNATTGTVSFYNNSSTTALGSGTVSGGTATFTTTALPAGTNSVVGVYNGINATSTSSAVTVNVAAPFTLSATPASVSVSAGQQVATTITVTPVGAFTGVVNFTNSTTSNPGSCTAGLPAGALCTFNQAGMVTISNSSPQTITMTISSAANMALPSGAQAITITGTSGSTMVTTTVNLTVTATNQSYTLTTTSGAGTFPVAVGGTATVSVTVTGMGSPINFVANSTTALPLTYTCTGVPSLPTSEISCQLPNNGQPTNASVVTFSLVTTPVTTQLRPLRGRNIFYALLLPGLFGVVFVAGSRTRGLRLLGMIVVLGCSTLWLGSCGGSSNSTNSLKNPGTPPGSYAVTVSATTGGTNPLTFSMPPITLQVGQ